MQPVITVGLDGSPGSLAAAHWAADEAEKRRLTLRLRHAWLLPVPEPARVPSEADQNHWANMTESGPQGKQLPRAEMCETRTAIVFFAWAPTRPGSRWIRDSWTAPPGRRGVPCCRGVPPGRPWRWGARE
ncbi:hypothetical protein GCM10027073_16110 [Streptomyces chlorus]